jgi:hypothetical protein
MGKFQTMTKLDNKRSNKILYLLFINKYNLMQVRKHSSGTGSVAQMVECLLCKHEVLSANTSPIKNNLKRKQSSDQSRYDFIPNTKV